MGLQPSALNSDNSSTDNNPLAPIDFLAAKLDAFNLTYLHVMRADFSRS